MLIDFWRRFDPKAGAPFVHPDDRPALSRIPSIAEDDFDRFVASGDFGRTGNRLLLGLLPTPYVGDLEHADIYILLLNPSFSVTDLYAESVVKETRDITLRMLYQDLDGEDFPFAWLSPKYCWTGAYGWWEKKLRALALVYAEHDGITHFEALQRLSKRIVSIELIPYHSANNPSRKLHRLPSVEAARRYVSDVVLPKATAGNAVVIATRKLREWGLVGLPSSDNVVLYDPKKEARSASMTPTSPGGRAILSRLGIPPGNAR